MSLKSLGLDTTVFETHYPNVLSSLVRLVLLMTLLAARWTVSDRVYAILPMVFPRAFLTEESWGEARLKADLLASALKESAKLNTFFPA